MINIENVKKSEVLAALYNNAKTKGIGIFKFKLGDMTPDEAQKIIDSGQTYFDYLMGRLIKVNLEKNEFNPSLYDRDNGEGSANTVIQKLKESKMDKNILESYESEASFKFIDFNLKKPERFENCIISNNEGISPMFMLTWSGKKWVIGLSDEEYKGDVKYWMPWPQI